MRSSVGSGLAMALALGAGLGLRGFLGPAPPPRPPGTNCVDACSDKWQACHGSCTQNACAACDKSYMKCAKVCFRSTLPP